MKTTFKHSLKAFRYMTSRQDSSRTLPHGQMHIHQPLVNASFTMARHIKACPEIVQSSRHMLTMSSKSIYQLPILHGLWMMSTCLLGLVSIKVHSWRSGLQDSVVGVSKTRFPSETSLGAHAVHGRTLWTSMPCGMHTKSFSPCGWAQALDMR